MIDDEKETYITIDDKKKRIFSSRLSMSPSSGENNVE